MPRYFFDLRQDGKDTRIAETELVDRAMAREYAIGLAQTLFSDHQSSTNMLAESIVYGDESSRRDPATERGEITGGEECDEEKH